MLTRPSFAGVRWPLAALVAALFLLAAAGSGCSAPGKAPAPAATAYTAQAAGERGPFGVGVTTLDLVDRGRPTEPNGDVPGHPERALKVEVWYPAAPSAPAPEARDVPVDVSGGPYPLIVFAHGLGSFRRQSASYTQHLASHGYVVAAPDFPLSNLATPGGARLAAVVNQPGDVSFVIESLLARREDDGDAFASAIDPNAIGVTGHSLGGLTSLLTVYGPFRDPRVRAAVAISPPGCFLTPGVVRQTSVPLMVVGGSRDLIVNPASIRAAYDQANRPRYFLELAGADHVRFADIDIEDAQVVSRLPPGAELAADAVEVAQQIGGSAAACANIQPIPDDPPMAADRQRQLLREFALPFFDAYLKGNAEAARLLQQDLPAQTAEARVEFELD